LWAYRANVASKAQTYKEGAIMHDYRFLVPNPPPQPSEVPLPDWIPDGCMLLRDAVDLFGKSWKPDAWTGEEVDSEDDRSEARHRLIGAYAALRQLFYSNTITTVLFAKSGKKIQFPSETWGAEISQNLFAMECPALVEKRRQTFKDKDVIKGWVLVPKSELEKAIKGIGSKDAPSDENGQKAAGSSYSTEFLDLMHRAIKELGITDENQPLKKVIVDWFLKQTIDGKNDVTPNQAENMASFVRKYSSSKGGLLGQPPRSQ
jgi:hypothetical protein